VPKPWSVKLESVGAGSGVSSAREDVELPSMAINPSTNKR